MPAATATSRTLRVLAVDDNREDRLLMRIVASHIDGVEMVAAVPDAVAALDYIREALEGNAALPDIVLVDLNMPGMDGLQLLESLKSDPAFRPTPVLIFSSSNDAHDIRRSYEKGAASFITKPLGLDGLRHTIASLQGYWAGISSLPSRSMG